MKCLIFSVFVFIVIPDKVYNFGSSIFAPSSVYGQRTKFDYDLSRFFPEFRIPPDSESQQKEKSESEVHQFQHGKGPIDTTQRFGASYGSSDFNTETNPRRGFQFPEPPTVKPFTQPFGAPSGSSYTNPKTNPQNIFGASYVSPFNVPPPQITTISTTTAKALPGQSYSSFNQKTQQLGTPDGYRNEQSPIDNTQSFGASYGSSYINTEANPKKDFGAPSIPFTTPPPLRTTTTKTAVPSSLLTSLFGGGDIKYKETETDYYDFDESDLHRPKYDIGASRKLFEEFVQKYGKTYKDKADEEKHYQNFVQSLNTINKLNSEGGSASFDINIMSDEDLSSALGSLLGK